MTQRLILDFGDDFWSGDRRLSGKRIDVLRGQNIPGNSRVIDRTLVPRGVVSHKSTDVRCKSYRYPSSLYRIGMRFARAVAAYRGEVRQDHQKKATYNLQWAVEGKGVQRILEWFIPASDVSTNHLRAIKQVVRDARDLGVKVRVIRIRG